MIYIAHNQAKEHGHSAKDMKDTRRKYEGRKEKEFLVHGKEQIQKGLEEKRVGLGRERQKKYLVKTQFFLWR